jgi:DNA polymerase III delta prime subunit
VSDRIEEKAAADRRRLDAIIGARLNSHDSARGVFGSPSVPPSLTLVNGASIKPQPIDWLWPGWLAKGKLHILAGAPGTGKTTIALALAASVTRGGRWPDGAPVARGKVLIWSAEDDPADTLMPRILAAGGDPAQIEIVSTVRDGAECREFDPARDLALLEDAALRAGGARLLICDPVVSAIAGDSHKNAEVRRSLQPLVNLGARLGCAVLGITHFTKGTAGRDPVERVTGSIAFGALARVVLATARTQDEDGQGGRIFVRAKSNIGPDGGGFGYLVEQVDLSPELREVSRIGWGAPLEGSARDLIGDAEAVADDERTAKEEAEEFLHNLLQLAPAEAKTIQAEAKKAGISWRTIERAKAALGVRSRRSTFSGAWQWSLPSLREGTEDRQVRQETEPCGVGGVGGLGAAETLGANDERS